MVVRKKRKKYKQKKEKKKKIFNIFFSIIFLICFQIFFSLSEKLNGLVAGEATNSITVSVAVVPSISIDAPSDISLSPNIEETGSAIGSATWNIETNNANGWKLEINASEVPAMQSGGDSFADYTEAISGTPDIWLIDSANSEFGFNSDGLYAESEFSSEKYLGFDGINRIQVAHRDAPSGGFGDDTTINFKAEVGSGHSQPTGTYSATIVASATTL